MRRWLAYFRYRPERSRLDYADGIILSSLLGNNNGTHRLAALEYGGPSELNGLDVMYGPFSAAHPVIPSAE